MTDETTTPAEPVTTVLLVFVRRVDLDGGQEGRVYYRVTDAEFRTGTLPDDIGEATHIYSKKVGKHMGGRAGIVYRVPSPKPGTIVPGEAKWAGLWPNDERRVEWQSLDDAWYLANQLQKKTKAAKEDDAILECLEPLRSAYWSSVGLQRNILLARVVQYLTRRP